MKLRIKTIFKAIFSALALLTVFYEPIQKINYVTTVDYVIAFIYDLLAVSDVKLLLVTVAFIIFFAYIESVKQERIKGQKILALFFAAVILCGDSLYRTHSVKMCFGSALNFLKFSYCLVGYAIFFDALLTLVFLGLYKVSKMQYKDNFFTKNGFLKAFIILLVAYTPFVLISYPGNLCWDVLGQIEQVITDVGYSTHHPLMHTLLVGGMVKLGQNIFHSYEAGLFIYMIIQLLMFVTALSASIGYMAKRKVIAPILWTVMYIYMFSPIYSNLVSTAIKDIPFIAFVIGYVICIARICTEEDTLSDKKFILIFVLVHIGVIGFRNNGFPLVFITDLGLLLHMTLSNRRVSESGESTKSENIVPIRNFALSAVSGIVVAKVMMYILTIITSAAPGSKGEMLSIPFQQTARYISEYREEISDNERIAIEAVLGDVDIIADAYDADISDPVKALYNKNATASQLLNYFRVWIKEFLAHPGVYFEAFFVHIYGWFDPAVSNAIRYETDYVGIKQGGLFPQADKILIFYYRFADRFLPLSLIQNVGVYVWALFILALYQCRKQYSKYRILNLPLWVSLLICMASPCFINQPRYALPILFTLPFLYGITLSGNTDK